MNRALKAVSVATTALMYIVLQMGALVTNTGSQDGCGESWPLCHGTFMPEWDYAAIIEFSHRGVSGLAGLLTLILAVWLWRAYQERPLLRWLGLGALFFVTFQGLLGAAAVVWPQPKTVLALHFGISLICFSLVLLVTVLLFRKEGEADPAPVVPPQFRNWVWWVTLFTYGVIYLGALVRHLRASRACLGWPLCNGELIPTLYGPVGASFAHRVAAALSVILIVRTALLARQFAGTRPLLVRSANLAAFLLLLQVASGAVMALDYVNLLTQMVHSAIITAFWGALTVVLLEATPVRTAPAAPHHSSRPLIS